MAKKKTNSVPLKNYVIAILISALAIFLTYYIFCWFDLYKENKYEDSYLISSKTISLEVNDIEEIENTLTEAPSEYFVFISYRNDEQIYKLEKKLKKIIDSYNINDNFYYIDITKLKEEDNYIEKLNKVLGLKDDVITKVPTIIYFKDGEVAKDGIVVREDEKIMDAGDFEHLLEMYEFKKVS